MTNITESPWGKVGDFKNYDDCYFIVHGQYHGGHMITESFAEKYLSPLTLNYGGNYLNYFCYEEDCLWRLPIIDLIDNRKSIKEGYPSIYKYVNSISKSGLIIELNEFYPGIVKRYTMKNDSTLYERIIAELLYSNLGKFNAVISTRAIPNAILHTNAYKSASDEERHLLDMDSLIARSFKELVKKQESIRRLHSNKS